jgi:hypothetical protein
MSTRTYRFTFTLGGIPEIPAEVPDAEFVERMTALMDEIAGRILAAGCDDACQGSRGDTHFLDFDREAESLGDAMVRPSTTSRRPAIRCP